MTKKYTMNDADRVKLSEYADKWRAISRRTGDYTAEQLDALPGVLRPLYERLGWEPTERELRYTPEGWQAKMVQD